MNEVQLILSRGKVTVIDAVDLWVTEWKWYARPNVEGTHFYAVRCTSKYSIGPRSIILHRLLLNAPSGLEIDHVNGDTLDNRRCNLRLATHSQNLANQKFSSANTSGFRGVSWDRASGKWLAQTRQHTKTIFIGRFLDPIEAARAYDQKARELFGEFARTNFSYEIQTETKTQTQNETAA